MFEWLYRHVFRGIGFVFLVGLITILVLAVSFLAHKPHPRPASPPASTAQHPVQ